MRNALTFHVFFAPKYRAKILAGEIQNLLENIMPELVQQFGGECLACAIHDDDHIHIVVNLPSSIALDDFMRDLKSASGRIANRQRGTSGSPFWQKRFMARTVNQSTSDQRRVIEYVNRNKKTL